MGTQRVSSISGVGPAAVGLADLLDAAKNLPAARAVARGTEMRVPVTARNGATVLVTFRRVEPHDDRFARCWWQPQDL